MVYSTLVPVTDYLVARDRAAVRDARTGEPVWFPAESLVLRGVALCVRAEVVARDRDGLARVVLPGGAAAWVRPSAGPTARAA